MRIRNTEIRNCDMHTEYGLVSLDELGFVIDVENPPEDPEDFLRLPTFVDGDLFPPPPIPKTHEQLKAEEEAPPAQVEFGYLEYKSFIKDCLDGGAAQMNSAGAIDMAWLNAALRTIGQRPITGTQRLRLQKEIKEEEDALAAEAAALEASNPATPPETPAIPLETPAIPPETTTETKTETPETTAEKTAEELEAEAKAKEA